MRVKEKSLFVVTLVIVLLTAFFLIQGISQHNSVIDLTIEKEEETIDQAIDTIQKYLFAPYHVRIAQIAEDREDIARAFAEGDRELLYRLAHPLYRDMREENAHFHAWDFNLPDGTVFLRVQKPEFHGDNIGGTRAIVGDVHDRRTQITGFDIGKHGAIYWIAQPVFHGGEYVGAMEFGLPAEQLVKDLEEKFHTEVTTLINAEKWDKATFIKEGYRVFGDRVLLIHGGSIYEKIPKDFVFTPNVDQRIDFDGRAYVLHSCAHLEDHEGDVIGSILVLQDITEEVARKRTFIAGALLVAALIIVCSLAVLYVSFSSLIGRLERYAEETRRAKEESENARGELERRVEERAGELKEAYAFVREQHVFLQTILESLTNPFYVIDAETYRIVMANKAARPEGEGGEEGLTCYRMTHNRTSPCTGEDHPCSLQEVKKTKRPHTLEHVHTGKDGEERNFEIYAYPVLDRAGKVVQVIEYCVDVTEKKEAEREREKLEKQLQQSLKMEAMGTLAGGIAHDFNNILSAIFGFTDILRYELPPESEAQGRLDSLLKAGNRAKDLVKQILTFSRQGEQEKKPFQIHLLVKEALKLLRASIPVTIEMREEIEDCGLVLADPTQIHQVVMNLCTNAYHAMREGKGVIAVSLSVVDIDGGDSKVAALTLQPGKYVRLGVSDTGHGMDRGVAARIFDPYFTTKAKGEGTGMGLAVVHGIVRSHGGHISVYSEPGIGTTFNVYFPVFEAAPQDRRERDRGERVSSIESLVGGSERILVVDDEEQIVEVEEQMLASLGYRVAAFTNSLDALQAFQENPEGFDLVISDMTMPSMTGLEMAQKILALRPDIPFVLCTGFSEMIDGEKSKASGIRKFVMKPVVKADLARIVRVVLEGSEPPESTCT
jgi:signal transduction histidine kinase/ActR/RegA family two-component response regulator